MKDEVSEEGVPADVLSAGCPDDSVEGDARYCR